MPRLWERQTGGKGSATAGSGDAAGGRTRRRLQERRELCAQLLEGRATDRTGDIDDRHRPAALAQDPRRDGQVTAVVLLIGPGVTGFARLGDRGQDRRYVVPSRRPGGAQGRTLQDL